MRSLLVALALGAVALYSAGPAHAQEPGGRPAAREALGPVIALGEPQEAVSPTPQDPGPAQARTNGPPEQSSPAQGGSAPGSGAAGGRGRTAPAAEDRFTALQKAQGAAQQDEKLPKKLELLQKQLEVQQKEIELLKEQVQQRPLAGSPVEKLQTQVATLEARSTQAARRDQELAQGIDNLTEHLDAEERNGPRLPATLKELFLPSQTNETPLSIYGTLVAGYQLFPSKAGEGEFFFDGLEPIFLLQLNDKMLLEAELEFRADGVEVGYAQMDYIVNDWLTLVGGRFLAPIGFFNERLHPAWINKLPDFPLMMRQVSLADFSLNGVQARGAHYLCCSPLKLEYSVFLANGLGVPGTGQLTDLADLGALKDTTHDVNEAMAFGGRVGLWWPEVGFAGGLSAFFNRAYAEDAGTDINLWG
jgi:hypothetical protein